MRLFKRYNLPILLALGVMLMGGALLMASAMSLRAIDITSRALLAAGCIAIIAVSALGIGGKKSPAYTKFGRDALITKETGLTFGDVAANAEAKQSLEGLVDYLKDPQKYASFGARMPRGVMFYGPPGTGKTLLARALAGEAGVPFFAMSGSDFVQMYVGVGASRVRDLFAGAKKAGKCVIFIDEIDALGRRRSDQSSDERDQTLNALLNEMSGFRTGDGVIVIAATNRIETLDPALLRPGRFDRQIEVGLPGLNERLDILTLHSKNKPLASDVDLAQLARETCAFSGASLESLLNEAAILAARRESGEIERGDIDQAFYRTVAGADGVSAATPDERCTIALHEAGHAIILRALTPESRLKRVSILPASRGAQGYNLAIPTEKVLHKKTDIENQIMVFLGGRAAELLVGGEDALTSGASSDIARATELAGTMIMELGMGDNPAVSLRALSSVCGGGGSAEQACRDALSGLYQKTREILEDHINELLTLTEALLERETLDAEEIEALFSSEKAIA
jgi:cell division protease FtsH